ncbi:putative disease resistance RPP13-like protein 2 [Cicer arietinum]|uniref:Disease resistance RPP13-like protein 2 n=1 Tax=Cicer arietinum TaxID=3827 RepID=V5THC2_CICAR|nr:putative disease resistance RPP13-like protein 2 [Cicer arietinum]AHB64355.1 NBS-LRR protein [Cicer arietinum]
MAEIVLDVVASMVANFLIEEYAVLGDAVRHVEWIEIELRSMRGLLEQVEQRGDGEQEQALTEWAENLTYVAVDAKNVIETFVIKSVKRRRLGVLHWFDKYKIGKQLEQICRRMRAVSHIGMSLNTNIVSVFVENPALEGEVPPPSSATVVAAAMEKLDHILNQNLITGNKVIKMVEQVKDGLKDLQNIVSKLKSTNERESVWLEEVKIVSTYTTVVAENFIAKRESKKVLYEGCVPGWQFKKKMKYVRTQIGDALDRSLTYEVGGQLDMRVRDKQTTAPVPNLPAESLIISELIPVSITYTASFFVPHGGSWAAALLFVGVSQAFPAVAKRGTIEHKPNIVRRTHELETNQKEPKKRRAILRLLKMSIVFYIFIDLMILILSLFLPLHIALLFQLIIPLYEVIAWTMKLWRSMDKNLKCVERDLALMHAFFRDTKSTEGLNERQRVWVGQLKAVAQYGQSLLDACPKGRYWSRRLKFAMDINCLLEEILNICDRKVIYGITNIQGTQQEFVHNSHPRISMQEETEIQRIVEQHDPEPEPAASSSYCPVTGLKKEVQSIRGEEELMDALFRDMIELDRRSRIWVEQMRGIASDIASVINQYDAKLRYKSILTYTFKYWTRRVISKEIDAVRKKIEEASRRRRAYGLVQFRARTESSSSTMVQGLRGTTQLSLVAKEFDVIGFDDDAQVLMAQLLSGEKRRSITSIVGIGGTGKTALAKFIFGNKDIENNFENRVWVSLPSNSSSPQLVEETTKKVAKQIMVEDGSISSCNNQDVLQTLAHKKYLIVVDGIETSHALGTLKEAIPDMSTGSRFLLTTRNINVARDTTFAHPLQLLDDESSWVLFTKHLKVDIPQEELIKVGREIVIKCGGLPLQILKMSEFLSHKEDVKHEERSSMLEQDQTQRWSETLKTIDVDLPLYLRGCLSYFGLFPAEFGIPVRRLVILWVAEERVHHGEDQELPEQVAERYLTKLIDQNLVQIAKRKRNGKVKTCRLPYALRQLWWTKGNNSIFLKANTTTDSNAEPKNSIIRWVTDHLNTDHIWYNHIHGDSNRNDSASLRTYYKDVRSFLSFDAREGSKPGQEIGNFMKVSILSDCFLLLRVLDLERVYKPKLPKTIARLSQLRYLGLRWTYLESLPSFISKLLKLQTLDLKHTYIHTLPTSIWEMELRHLFLSETFHSRLPPQRKDHFSFIGFLLPQLRDNFLHDLQTLWGLFVDEETPVKNGLDTLVSITKLGLACQQMSLQQEAMTKQLEAVADWIAKLEHLQSLRLKSRDEEGKPWILHLKSFENNVNLTDMYLLGKLSSSSILSQFPNSLIELTLSHSKLEEDPMQLLKELSNLRTLSLLRDSYVGQTMYCQAQVFPRLHVLKFWVLQQLEEWIIESGALPCLRQLEIRSCSHLKMLPYGLMNVNTLLELKLTNMPTEINAEAHNIPPNCQVVQTNFQ